MGRKKPVDFSQDIDDLLNEGRAPADASLDQKSQAKINPSRAKKKEKKAQKSKKYQELAALVDKNRLYGLTEAIDVCKKVSTSKFVGSLELHLNLGLDQKDDTQKIKTQVVLPFGTGKEVKIMAMVEASKAKKCFEAGANFIGNDETIEEILRKPTSINFDRLVATPDFMPKLAKVAKILGPKGLMPSPKSGTVSMEPEKIVAELKKGRLEVKTEANAPIIHLGLGKLSFPTGDLEENFKVIIKVVKEAKPAKAPADFLASASLSPTMGPAVRLDLTAFR